MNSDSVLERLSDNYIENTPDSREYNKITDKIFDKLYHFYNTGDINSLFLELSTAVYEEEKKAFRAGFSTAFKIMIDSVK